MPHSPKAVVLNIVIFLILAYLAILLLMYLFQERLIFIRQPIISPAVESFSRQEVRFERDGISLHGWFFKSEASTTSPLIVYYGGNAEEVSGNLQDLRKFPPASLLFVNYRGYGRSSGNPTQKNLVEDAVFVLDEITGKEGIGLERVVLMGRSLGSGVAVQVAYRRKVGGVILVAPFDSLARVAKTHYPVFPVKLLIRHPFASIGIAGEIETPALCLMAATDQVIPNHHSKALIDAWGGPIKSVLIGQAHHNDIQLYPRYWSSIKEFLMRLAL